MSLHKDPLRLRPLTRAVNFIRHRKSNVSPFVNGDPDGQKSANLSGFLSRRPAPTSVEAILPSSGPCKHAKQRRSTLAHVSSAGAHCTDAAANVTEPDMPKNRLSELYCGRRRNRRSTMTHVPAQFTTEPSKPSNTEQLPPRPDHVEQPSSNFCSLPCPRDIHVGRRPSLRSDCPPRSSHSAQTTQQSAAVQSSMHSFEDATPESWNPESFHEISVAPLSATPGSSVPLERHLQQSHRRSTLTHVETSHRTTHRSDSRTVRSESRAGQSIGSTSTRLRPNHRVGRTTRRGASRSPQRSVRCQRSASQSPQRSNRPSQAPLREHHCLESSKTSIAGSCSSYASENRKWEQKQPTSLERSPIRNLALNNATLTRKHQLQSLSDVTQDDVRCASRKPRIASRRDSRLVMKADVGHSTSSDVHATLMMESNDGNIQQGCISRVPSTSGSTAKKISSQSSFFYDFPNGLQSAKNPRSMNDESSHRINSDTVVLLQPKAELSQVDATCASISSEQDDAICLIRLQHRLHRSSASSRVDTPTTDPSKIIAGTKLSGRPMSPAKYRSSSRSRGKAGKAHCREAGIEQRTPLSTRKRSTSPSKRGRKASPRVALDSPSSTKSIDALTISTVDETIGGSCGSISFSPENQIDGHHRRAAAANIASKGSSSVSSSIRTTSRSRGIHEKRRNQSPGATTRSSLRMLPVSQLLEQSSSTLTTTGSPNRSSCASRNTVLWDPVDFDMDDDEFFREEDQTQQ